MVFGQPSLAESRNSSWLGEYVYARAKRLEILAGESDKRAALKPSAHGRQ